MKKLFTVFLISIFAVSVFAQSDDDFFFDDGIEEVTDVSASSDLSKGIIFQNGSVKIGGSLSSSIETSTVLLSKEDNSFADNLEATTFSPTLSSTLSVDARPLQDLRIYSKFAFNYPFKKTNTSPFETSPEYLSNAIKVKECFTDFTLGDNTFFRFGVHTVSWGTGYFFSPVSDIINTSSIDPENTSEQVDGSLNLRTQITFPDSLNCLWLYVVAPSDNKAVHTALAGKYEFVIGGWELGTGLFYQYEAAPKVMVTASGSLKKMSLFGEAVYQYGGDAEWSQNPDWDNKTSIFQGTAGFSYYWKDPQITLAGQYYYDGNNVDLTQFTGGGHNIALMTNFGKIGKCEDLSISVFGLVNIGKTEATVANLKKIYNSPLTDVELMIVANTLNNSAPSAIFSATMTYAVNNALSFGMGPYITVIDWDEKPTVALKLNAKLGGGNF